MRLKAGSKRQPFWRARGTSTIDRTRAGRLLRTTMRSPISRASSTSWVTNTIVLPCAAATSASSACIDERVWASRAPNGSSISNTRGSMASVRASCTRWRMPPDSSRGRWSSYPSRPTSTSRARARDRRAARLCPRSWSASSTLRWALRQGSSASSWNIMARSAEGPVTPTPPTRTSPAVQRSRPATARSRVDFPQPDGPRSITISPGRTMRSMSSTASSEPP